MERWLNSLSHSREGIDFRRIRTLANLCNIRKKYFAISVGGTNGKGSVASMLASIFKQAGYKVGLNTSPHLLNVRERIKINGKKISKRKFEKILKRIKKISRKIPKELRPTFFEVLTAAALIHFQEEGVEIVILEVGMGGRLDATNIIDADIAVITNVEKEHAKWLGGTVEKIAYEKAGIIKKNSVVVSGCKGRAEKIIEKKCKRENVKLFLLNRDFKIKNKKLDWKKKIRSFEFEGKNKIKNLEMKMLGRYELSNAALAIEVAEILGVDEEAIREGIEKAEWAGRFEIVRENPLLIFDGAHNPAGAKALSESMKEIKKYVKIKRSMCIFAVLKDKEWKKMLDALAADEFVITEVKNERKLDAEKIADYLESKHRKYKTIKESKKALEYALKHSDKLILACGSLYLIGELETIRRNTLKALSKSSS